MLGAGDVDRKFDVVWSTTPKTNSLLSPGEQLDRQAMLLSDNTRFIATLADDNAARAGVSVLFFDGTDYLTVSVHAAATS